MNTNIIKIDTPLERRVVRALKAGDRVLLSGEILVFRDQVHRILYDMICKGSPLPFSLKDAVLYYCGPTPARHGMPVGSAGPTTASRMDKYMDWIIEQGVAVTIGKGDRSPEVIELHKKYHAVYMAAVGGTGALLAKHVSASTVIAFPELGTEAARIFKVTDMPLIVAIDSRGNSAFFKGERIKANKCS